MVYRWYTDTNYRIKTIILAYGVWYIVKSCFFIGHRDAPERIQSQLTTAVERLIVEENVGYFYVGQYGSFDRMAALTVKQMKRKYPYISLYLVLPYHPAERPVPAPVGFDGTYYPEGMETVPKRYAIVRANKQLVKSSDWLLVYVCHPGSNARNLLEYAQRREQKGLIHIENLAGGTYEY